MTITHDQSGGLPEVEAALQGRLHPAAYSDRRGPAARATATLLLTRTPDERRQYVAGEFARRKNDTALQRDLSAVALAARDLVAESGGTDLSRQPTDAHENDYAQVVARTGVEQFPLAADARRYAPPPPPRKGVWPYN